MTRLRSDLGRRNKQIGDQFEEWASQQHQLAALLGILAHVEKTQAKSKIVNGRIIFDKPGIADFVGCLEGGRYLAAETKSTDDVRLPRSAISPKQQEHLTAVALAGGLSLLMVEFRTTGVSAREGEHVGWDSFMREIKMTRYAVPWLEIPWTILRTAESVLEKDIAQWLVQPGTCYLSRWHAGGPRSGAHSVGSQRYKVYPRE